MTRLVPKAAFCLLSILFCGQINGLVHFMLVQHEICPEHGVATRHSDSKEETDHRREPHHSEKEGCQVLALFSRPNANIAPEILDNFETLVLATVISLGEDCFIPNSRGLFTLSPANSPPLV